MSYVSESDQTPIIFYYFNGQSDTIATEEFFFLENTVFVLLIKLSALENFFFHELYPTTHCTILTHNFCFCQLNIKLFFKVT